MKNSIVALIVSAIGLTFVLASPAEAAKKKHRNGSRAAAHATTHGGAASNFQNGALAGPLYNGQDYLGDDPDPNIRAYLLKDLSGRYGGGGP